MKEEIFIGDSISLIDLLDARDKRRERQLHLLNQFNGESLISITMNIPGNVKNSKVLQEIFNDFIIENIEDKSDFKLIYSKYYCEKTGPECLLVSQLDPSILKRLTASLETNTVLGRIFDIDVLYQQNDQMKLLKRSELSLPERQCYLCKQSAKFCSKNQSHSIDELRAYIIDLIMTSKSSYGKEI